MVKKGGKLLPADSNRAARIQLIRELDNLLRVATEPGFRGSVSLQVHAANGQIGTWKLTTEIHKGA